jgi:starch synthase (maltosyl-transferring)
MTQTGRILLEPGQVYCLTDDPGDLEQSSCLLKTDSRVARIACFRQRLRAKALEVWRFYRGVGDLGGNGTRTRQRAQMQASPLAFCRTMNPDSAAPRTVVWQFPVDLRREVMVPPGHFLLVSTGHPFRASMTENGTVMAVEESLTDANGGAFVLFRPLPVAGRHKPRTLSLPVTSPTAAPTTRPPFCTSRQPGRSG